MDIDKQSATRSPDDRGARSPLDWPREAGIGREMAAEIRAEVRRRRARVRAAATACMLLIAGIWLWPDSAHVTAPAVAAVRVNAPRMQSLPDGSGVELRDGSEIRVTFSASVRRVELTHGEAHFKVAKDPLRPFVVTVDGVEVSAIGTAFAVGRGASAIDILVTEGRVAVTRPREAEARQSVDESAAGGSIVESNKGVPVFLDAGNQVSIAVDPTVVDAPQIAQVTAAELAQRLSWRVPRFEFSGADLSHVVQLFNAHGFAQLALGDPTLSKVKVSGILRADNVEALLELLAADHGIAADRVGQTIVLRRRL